MSSMSIKRELNVSFIILLVVLYLSVISLAVLPVLGINGVIFV